MKASYGFSTVASSALITAFIFSIIATATCTLPFDARRSAVARKLVPAQRDASGKHHGVCDETTFIPQPSVILDYYSNGSDQSPVATVTFNAHADYPIAVIESFNSVLKLVQCNAVTANSTSIDLHFFSEDDVLKASNIWMPIKNFYAVTSHIGCNPDDERGAWRVHALHTDTTNQSIRLLAEQVSFKNLGYYDVSFTNHGIFGRLGAQSIISKTILPRADESFNAVQNLDFSGRQIFPGNPAPPLSQDIKGAILTSGLVVTCVQCTSDFNFTVDLDFSVNGTNITAFAASAIINNLEQSVLLGVSVVEELSKDASYDLITVPLDPLEIPGIFKIGPAVGVSVDFGFDMSAGVNFTFGAKASVNPETVASIDFFNQDIINATGWDGVKIEPLPIRVDGAFNLTLSATVSPFISIGLGAGSSGIDARITENGPNINFDVELSANVNRNCDPVGSNDFESYAAAYRLGADMTFGAVASLDIGIDTPFGGLGANWTATIPQAHIEIPIFSDSGPTGTARPCYVIVDDSSSAATSGPIMTPAPTGTPL